MSHLRGPHDNTSTQHGFPYVSTFVTIEEFDNCWIQHREFRKEGEEETLVAIYYEISERK